MTPLESPFLCLTARLSSSLARHREVTALSASSATHNFKPPETCVSGGDWWLVEYDTEDRIAWGYACLGDPGCAEWGYVSLTELEAITVRACAWWSVIFTGHPLRWKLLGDPSLLQEQRGKTKPRRRGRGQRSSGAIRSPIISASRGQSSSPSPLGSQVMTPPTAPPGPWIEQWLSPPRFQTYLTEAAGDRQRALALYEWNTTMAAAILHDLAHVEVAVRNAYNDALVDHQAGLAHWTSDEMRYFPIMRKTAKNGRPYDENETPRDQIAYARRSAGIGAPPGKVVAELMFGFWRYLSISAREVPLWRSYLHHGFMTGTSRAAVDGPMSRLHRLRNRVAHHEPLLRQNLPARRHDVADLLGCISPDLQRYVVAQSTWAAVESQRP